MILPSDVIVLAVDGGRLVLMRNEGDATSPRFEVIEHRECPPLPNRDIFADAPGRTYASHSQAGSFYDNGDPHSAHERAFLASAMAELEKNIDDRTPGIIIAADPVSLGHLRNHYPREVKAKLLAEFDKDLTGMPVAAIVRHLADAEIAAGG